jgi:hypothetical protein
MKKLSSTALPALSLAAMFLLAGCATTPPPEPLNIANTIEVTATVEKIDLAKRLITLKPASGESFTVELGPEVRNLPQMKVGDRVVARYFEAIGATLVASGAAGAQDGATIDLGAARAEAGQRPAGAIGTRASVPVTISAVNKSTNTVSFFGEDGLVRALTVQKPEAQAFIARLKPGDRVLITFTEALAISVEPAN